MSSTQPVPADRQLRGAVRQGKIVERPDEVGEVAA
jgi:hypothetical protein